MDYQSRILGFGFFYDAGYRYKIGQPPFAPLGKGRRAIAASPRPAPPLRVGPASGLSASIPVAYRRGCPTPIFLMLVSNLNLVL